MCELKRRAYLELMLGVRRLQETEVLPIKKEDRILIILQMKEAIEAIEAKENLTT